jgi:hypothetical protein
MVRAEEVSRLRHSKGLAVPTLKNDPLKSNGHFQRRAHLAASVIRVAPLSAARVAVIAMLLADKTSLGALCTNMQIRAALEFLDGRGYLKQPQPIDSNAMKLEQK